MDKLGSTFFDVARNLLILEEISNNYKNSEHKFHRKIAQSFTFDNEYLPLKWIHTFFKYLP